MPKLLKCFRFNKDNWNLDCRGDELIRESLAVERDDFAVTVSCDSEKTEAALYKFLGEFMQEFFVDYCSSGARVELHPEGIVISAMNDKDGALLIEFEDLVSCWERGAIDAWIKGLDAAWHRAAETNPAMAK